MDNALYKSCVPLTTKCTLVEYFLTSLKHFIVWIMIYLLSKIKFCGVWGKAERMFKTYLNDRKQEVELKYSHSYYNTHSNSSFVKYGLPSRFNTWSSAFPHTFQWSTPTINCRSKFTLFDNEVSVIISYLEMTTLIIAWMINFASLNKWFKARKVTLNFDKKLNEICYWKENVW
jgi:hypothetical protein